ncbi:Hypothetical protein SRAE_2000015200 [Strongyloides ratti]|uniref:Uncharacterized protein n=1 Tax=Strongyloides ratti TaxID=34506 RepID=A0A090L6U6_STRRB|nr:Hypothetical protein SRAE_2000015200 [Strongyloides ratti]CEF65472.1 Hypothetical protein SRAE_2000015200 [Strongyloides ratti]
MAGHTDKSEYSRENLAGKLKPSKELLQSGVKIYYSSNGCQTYKVVTLSDVFIKENKVYCELHFVDNSGDQNTTIVDIEKLIENSLIEENYLDENKKSRKKYKNETKDGIVTYKYYKIKLEECFEHLDGYPFNSGYISLLKKYLNQISFSYTSPNIASPEKNALLILDHFAKLDNQISPFSDKEYIDTKSIMKYKNDFVDLANKFNKYGPKFTIFYETNTNMYEMDIYISFHNNNPNFGFAIFANAYNVIRFINNIFIEHAKNPNGSVATEFGINRLVGIANLISDNQKYYLQDYVTDFNRF